MPMRKPLPLATTPRMAKLKVRQAVIFILAICLSLVALTLWGAWSARQHQLHDKEVAILNLAQALSSQVQGTIKQVDTALFDLVERLEVDGIASARSSRLQRLLDRQRAELPQLHGLLIFDAQGNWLASAGGVIPPNVTSADREYFIFHRDHPDTGPHIGPSIRARNTGDWVLTVSRRINHADGSFAGVALATIYLEHFLTLYRSMDVGHNGVVNLIAADATIIVRHPFNEADIGTSLAKAPLFSQFLPKAPAGTATIRSVIDGVERIVGYQRVADYPLVMFVGVDRAESLASWRKESWFTAALTALLLVILGTLGYRLVRLMRRQNHVQRALLRAQEQLLEVNQSLHLQALEDGLTGLANRRQFDQFIQDEMGRARRNQSLLALLMIDVDHFKRFNDQYGHLAGDDCLKSVAATIRSSIQRPGDLAARYGGEEFAVVLPGTDAAGAMVLAEKIRLAVEQLQLVQESGELSRVTISIGVSALVPSLGELPAELIAAADRALYLAKSSGRNLAVTAV